VRPIFFFLGAGLVPGLVLAQGAPVTPPSIDSGLAAEIITALASTITDALAALTKNEGFMAAGTTITYLLFAIMFSWALIKTMIAGEGINEVIAELIPLFASVSIIHALLSVNGVAAIVQFLESAAATMGAKPDLGQDIMHALQRGFVAIINITTMPSSTTNVPLSLDALSQALGIGLNAIISMIGRLVAAVIITLAMVVYIAGIVVAHASIMLAVALAPLMIPFLIVPALSWIFDGWLKFTIAAGMTKVVGAFMLSLTEKIMEGLAVVSGKVALPANSDFAEIATSSMIINMGLILLAGLCAFLMVQVPGIANGLIRGATGIGFNMGGFKSASPSLPTRSGGGK